MHHMYVQLQKTSLHADRTGNTALAVNGEKLSNRMQHGVFGRLGEGSSIAEHVVDAHAQVRAVLVNSPTPRREDR